MRRQTGALVVLTVSWLLILTATANAQYFGQNKVQHREFTFSVLETGHFDIYFYPAEATAAHQVARMAERWYARFTHVLGFPLRGRQPIVLYGSHPEFAQTNVVEGFLGEGIGGVTESGLRRIVMPLGATLADTDHVLGHELVHAFQYDILGRNADLAPQWVIEGMAEYLSLGAHDAQTAMWLRDAAYADELPGIGDLRDPRFFPYRFGHAFWAYLAGRYGDPMIGRFLQALSPHGQASDPRDALRLVTGVKAETLAADWHASIRREFDIAKGATRPAAVSHASLVIGADDQRGRIDVGPALSPDGTRIAFLSARNRLSIDLYLADASTGRVVRRLTSTATDPHFDSLQFLASAGAWSPDGHRLAVATVRDGRPTLAIFRADTGDVVREIRVDDDFPALGEIFGPAWSPDGTSIAFAGQLGGFTDLYVCALATGATRRLTHDAFADLQPAWSPDGRRLAFVTERFSSNLDDLSFGPLQLAILDVASGSIERVTTGLGGNHTDPAWSPDGRRLYFVGTEGRPDAYEYRLGAEAAVPFTEAPTGVAGITPTSPALSVARDGHRVAVSVFRNRGYQIDVLPTSAIEPVASPPRQLAVLPPPDRQAGVVAAQLAQPKRGLPPARPGFPQHPYRADLSLVGVGQQIGVSTGAVGTFVGGGIDFQFSDILGRHLLGVSADVNGGVKDIGGGLTYLDRTSRWTWGVYGARVPLRFAAGAIGTSTLDGRTVLAEETDLLRQTITEGGALLAYPFSRALRVEFHAGARHVGFDREAHTSYFDPVTGGFLGRQTMNLAAPESLTLGNVGAALVRDTTAFGPTGPIVGQRFRLELSPTFGDLRLNEVAADFRQYFMPVTPVTIAGRILHVGRYGGSAEDRRLAPLYLGYPNLVRGYDAGSFSGNECTPTSGDSCPEITRLTGSRILVTNLEVRAPLVGLFKGRLDYGTVPADLLAFADAGLAWTSEPHPATPRRWVTSVGVGTRVNLFGFAIAEVDLVRALQRPHRGWAFTFNFRPGF